MAFSNKITAFQPLAIPTSGNVTIDTGAFTFPTAPNDSYTDYFLYGTPTLSGNVNIVHTGTTFSGLYVRLYNASAPVLSGFALTIFGVTVPDNLVLHGYVAHCICTDNAGTWKVIIVPSWEDNGAAPVVEEEHINPGAVVTAKIADDAVTDAKIASASAGDVLVWDASGNPGKESLTDGKLLVGDTSLGAKAQAMSGDATITKAGVLTVANDAITTVKVADDAITPAKMSDAANMYTRDITLSFRNASEIGNVNFTMCEAGTIEEINVTVLDPAVTDTATLIYKDNSGTVLTASQTDITTGLAIGNIVSTTPTANNVFAAGDNLLIEMSKSTAGSCKVNVALCIKKA